MVIAKPGQAISNIYSVSAPREIEEAFKSKIDISRPRTSAKIESGTRPIMRNPRVARSSTLI
jgi:hypothetical protein